MKNNEKFNFQPGNNIIMPMRESAKPSNFSIKFIFILVFCIFSLPPYMVFSLGGANLSITRILMIFGIIILFMRLAQDADTREAFRCIVNSNKFIYMIYFFWIGWRVIGDINGENTENSLILTSIEVFSINNIFLISMIASFHEKGRKVIFNAIFLSILIVLFFGLIEYIFSYNIGSIIVGISDTSKYLAEGISAMSYRGDQLRVKSVTSHPIILAQLLASFIPLYIHYLKFSKSTFTFILCLLFIISAPIVIIATGARSGVVVGILSVISYFSSLVFFRSINIKSVASIFFNLIAIGVFFVFIYDDMISIVRGRDYVEASSSQSRNTMINSGLKSVSLSPVFGYGHGRSAIKAGLVGSNNILTIDNFYLSCLIDYGYVGVTILISMYVLFLKSIMRSIAISERYVDRSMMSVMFAASFSIVIGQYIISSWDNTIIIYLCTALSLGFYAENKMKS